MAAPILKIGKDPITLTIKKAKVVSGNFGNQLWCAVADHAGDEAVVYLPWVQKDRDTKEDVMSGVVKQFIKAGVMGPEDWSPEEGQYIEAVQDHTFTFEKVFKDGAQFINARLASGSSALKTAAVRELDLQAQQDEAAFAASLGTKLAPQPLASAPAARKQRETADARIARAYQHVKENYAEELAEMDPQLARAIVALTATFAIAYEKEG